jgi:serine protease Do
MENGDAFIITNYHVVYDENSRAANGIAEKIDVYLYGGEFQGLQMEATYVGGSMYYDLAVLRIEKNEILKHSEALAVQVANSDDVQVGTAAIAIGNAEGEGISVTSGVVSVDSEYLTMTGVDGMTSVDYRVMRIDTAVNSGNSGGGLFDRNGQLIGIVNAKIMDATVENIGYALPSSVVTAVVDNIIDYCYESDNENVMRPIMGITVTTTHSKAVYEEETGLLRVVETVVVYTVDPNLLGKVFQVGDQLISISINGESKTITRQYQLIDTMVTARPGDEVQFTVVRDGQEQVLTVIVTEDCLTAY